MMSMIVCYVFQKESQSNQYQFRPRTTSNRPGEENITILRRFFKAIINCSCLRQIHEEDEEEARNVATSSIQELMHNNHSLLSPRCKEAVKMACLYVGVYLLTFLFPYIANIIRRYKGVSPPFPILLLSRIFHPLQGFFNMLVYTRPHVITLRRRHGYTWGKALWETIFTYGGEVPYQRRRNRRRRFYRNYNRTQHRRSSRLVSVVGYASPRSPLAETQYMYTDNNSSSLNRQESGVSSLRRVLSYNVAEEGSRRDEQSPSDETNQENFGV